MKASLSVLSVALLALMIFWQTSTCTAAVVTFDDLVVTSPGNATFLTNTYQGLIWSNFAVLNAAAYTGLNGSNGYYNSMVSISNVALNAFGAPAEIDAFGTNFNFRSVYLTGAFNSNLNIEVEGLRGRSLVYSQVVVASATSPTLFTFNFLDLDRLTFNAFGGQDAGFPVSGGAGDSHFAMDNFTFEFVPEPYSLLLATASALLLWPFLKRKRA
jgi:hypothetical protein